MAEITKGKWTHTELAAAREAIGTYLTDSKPFAFQRLEEKLAAILEGVAEDAAEQERDSPRRPAGT